MKSYISLRTTALAMIFLSSIAMVMETKGTDTTPSSTATTSTTPEPSDSTVVAIISEKNGALIKKVTYGEVKAKAQMLPKQLTNNAKFKDIFPLLVKSVATEAAIINRAEKSGIKNRPEFKVMKEQCESGVLQKSFIDDEIDKLATEEELMKAYKEVKEAAPKGTEYNISMITVQDKQKANSILKDLTKAGAITKFAEYADKESLNKIPGGNLGFVRLEELPEPLRKPIEGAAQATIVPKVVEISMPDPSTPGKKVTTFNIIYVQGKRPAVFPPFESVKEELKTALSTKLAKEVIKKIEGEVEFQLFNAEGKPLDQKAEAPSAPAKAPEPTDSSSSEKAKGPEKSKGKEEVGN